MTFMLFGAYYGTMKKIAFALVFVLCVLGLSAQAGIELGLGFQYGTARIFDKTIIREITEPGIVAGARFNLGPIGLFARAGALFPSRVSEGDLTISSSNFNYILFINGALGPSLQIPLGPVSFALDLGLSINDLVYGGSHRENIDTRWVVKLEHLGTSYQGGREYRNIKMSESYGDIGIGLFGNAAFRFHFSKTIFMELAAAASFDFIRIRSYSFSADFSNTSYAGSWSSDFPEGKVEGDKLVLEKDSELSIFKQFIFIPSISVGFRF